MTDEHHHVTVVRRPPYDWEREELRDEVPDSGDGWKLNNSFTSLAARRLVEMDPTLRDVIEMRGRR